MGKNTLSVPVALINLPSAVLAFLLPVYCLELNMSALEITGTFSIASFLILLSRPLFGRITDRAGRKPLLIAAAALYAGSCVLFLTADSMLLVYCARAVQALASALLSVSIYAMVADKSKDNIAQRFGGITASASYGNIAGIVIAILVLSNVPLKQGWNRFFLICAAAAAIAAIYTFLKVSETKRNEAHEKKQKVKLTKRAVRVMAFEFAASALGAMLSSLLLIYLKETFTSDLSMLAIAFLPPLVVSSLLSSRLGELSDRHGRGKIIFAGLVITGLPMLCVTFANNLYWISLLWCLYYVGMIAFSSANHASFAEETQESTRGSLFGVYTAAGSVGGVIGPLLGGLFYEQFSKTAPFTVAGVLFLILAMLSVLINRGMKLKEGEA